ncbi:hypothetical protein GWI33_013564 [Rhynchophorus ferrugineus]|uniref:Uncharacterized protein n=1 Tax=Rhynchophorus ferrugineus TaxID=354439 RepID=A0A834I9D5_RHYFE|nr:hypothetical protein GWI33_013564 [Rhynchophorus ferrugineus]
MAECVFAHVKTRVVIYTPRPQTAATKKTECKGGRRSNVLIISAKGVQYRDALKTIKTTLASLDKREMLMNIRCTREGDLLIATDRDPDGVEEL